jgi:selenophosphate synthetase-related protein
MMVLRALRVRRDIMAIHTLNLTVEDAMSDEGFRRMQAMVANSKGLIRNVLVELVGGCLRFECEMVGGCVDPDQVEDIAQALVDIMCRELVYGWDLIEDAYISVFETNSRENYVSADLIYLKDRQVVRAGFLRKGMVHAVVYDYGLL